MQELTIELENDYGIKALKAESTEDKMFATYASNAVIKTSFAKVFQDLSNGRLWGFGAFR